MTIPLVFAIKPNEPLERPICVPALLKDKETSSAIIWNNVAVDEKATVPLKVTSSKVISAVPDTAIYSP